MSENIFFFSLNSEILFFPLKVLPQFSIYLLIYFCFYGYNTHHTLDSDEKTIKLKYFFSVLQYDKTCIMVSPQ